jgi:hypothetical protein
MTTSHTPPSVSRRTALAGLGAGGLGLALAATGRHAAAQDAATEMATHPLVGTWMTGTGPDDLAVVHFAADGNLTTNGVVVAAGPGGSPTYRTPFAGVWEPTSDRGIHTTSTALTFDATGAATGTVTVDGNPVAGDDGLSFWDDGTSVFVTVRDATGAVSQISNPVRAVAGVRMAPAEPGYVELFAMLAARQAATPTS